MEDEQKTKEEGRKIVGRRKRRWEGKKKRRGEGEGKEEERKG